MRTGHTGGSLGGRIVGRRRQIPEYNKETCKVCGSFKGEPCRKMVKGMRQGHIILYKTHASRRKP